MKYKGIIYVYTNTINGKQYVGQTVNEVNRKSAHKNCYVDTKFSRAIKKYGWSNFKYKVLVNCEENTKEKLKEVLDYWEKIYIDKLDTFNSGYNMTKGGEGALGVKRTEETKEKMSNEWHLHHKPFSNDVKERISSTLKNRYKDDLSVVNKKRICLYYLNGEFYKEYESIMECAKDLGLKSDSSIHEYLKGRNKTIKKLYKAKILSNE